MRMPELGAVLAGLDLEGASGRSRNRARCRARNPRGRRRRESRPASPDGRSARTRSCSSARCADRGSRTTPGRGQNAPRPRRDRSSAARRPGPWSTNSRSRSEPRQEDQGGDDQADDRIDPDPAGPGDQPSRRRPRRPRQSVGEHVEIGAANVDVRLASAREHQGGGAVDEDADRGDGHHRPGLDKVGDQQPDTA